MIIQLFSDWFLSLFIFEYFAEHPYLLCSPLLLPFVLVDEQFDVSLCLLQRFFQLFYLVVLVLLVLVHALQQDLNFFILYFDLAREVVNLRLLGLYGFFFLLYFEPLFVLLLLDLCDLLLDELDDLVLILHLLSARRQLLLYFSELLT